MDRRQTTEELINQLNELLEEAWTIPLSGGKAAVDRERVSELLKEINASYPEELAQARAVLAAQNDLRAAAERDADAIIRDAETRARRLVEDSAIVREARRLTSEIVAQKKAEGQGIISDAKAEADKIISEATAKGNQIISDATAKSTDLLKRSETRAAEVTKPAEKMSQELRTATSAYIENSVAATEQALTNSLSEIRRIKQQVRSGANQR
ncbi:MAG: hypothetical protein IIX84_03475 [Oscillospiraceae bacterium]|nr:hypothetical protein [Oscillospiraceae bacterium]